MKQNIDIESIAFIEVRSRTSQSGPLCHTKRLTDEQKKEFVEKFNKSTASGPRKAVPLYFISVHLKDGTVRKFRINAQYIKENTDYCFDLGDSKYIENILGRIDC